MGIIRKTKSVKRLLEIFDQSNAAISVVELVDQLRPEINNTTVYRILERLEKGDILHSFMGKDGLKWYAKYSTCDGGHHTSPHSHPHFQCSDCGKIECLALEITIPSLPNHKVDSANFLLIGQCGECMS
ncbi:MAG: transcriptional repressor [Bacteroidota bacterium]